MSDQYFKDKAEEIFNQIKVNEGWGSDSVFNLEDPTCKLIYISLKEVARDQRYACVDALKGSSCNTSYHTLQGIIQNANIKGKEIPLTPLSIGDKVIVIVTGKEGEIVPNDGMHKDSGKYKISFDASWVGWYTREELKLKGE